MSLVSAVLTLSLLAVPEVTDVPPKPVARTPAFEVNILWPIFPGGLTELKVMFPLLRPAEDTLRGELITGLYSDFSFGPITRPTDRYGKVFLIAAKLGWRQFFAYGLHLDVTVHLGWRHEEFNIWDGGTLDGFTGRLWVHGGWQVELTPRVYLNLRGALGVHLFRTDRHGDKERLLAPGGDINLGIRF